LSSFQGLGLKTISAITGPGKWCSGAGGLEELDRVARGVLEQDLLAARPADDVVAEGQARGPQPLDVGRDVLDDEVDAVPSLPAPACGRRASVARPSSPGR